MIIGIHCSPCVNGALLMILGRVEARYQVDEKSFELSALLYSFLDGVYERRIGRHHSCVNKRSDVILEVLGTSKGRDQYGSVRNKDHLEYVPVGVGRDLDGLIVVGGNHGGRGIEGKQNCPI